MFETITYEEVKKWLDNNRSANYETPIAILQTILVGDIAIEELREWILEDRKKD